MSENTVLFQLKENLYREGCPVLIESGALLLEPESGRVFSWLAMRNVSDGNIAAVVLDLHLFDRANTETEVIRDYRYEGLDAPRDAVFGETVEIPVQTEHANSFSVAVRRVVFRSGQTWEGSASLLYESLPPRTTVLEELEEQESADQYARDFTAEFAKDPTVKAVYVPDSYFGLWRCACGGINRAEEECCHLCGAPYLPQREHIGNLVQIAANLTQYRRLRAEEEEKARREAQRRAEAEAAAKAEQERQEEEARLRREQALILRARRRKIALGISIPAAVAVMIFVVVLVTYILPSGKYQEGVQLLETGSYDEALETFESLNGFGDSGDRISETKYRKALSLRESGSYREAAALFRELGDYEDAETRREEAAYQQALSLMEAEQYDEALTLLEEVLSYADAADQASACRLKSAQKALSSGDREGAAAFLGQLNETDSVALQKDFCEAGAQLYRSGKKTEAAEYFSYITDAGVLRQADAVYYADAVSLIEAGNYDEATKILQGLEHYEESAVQLKRISYLKASALLAEENYADALPLFQDASGYEDADTLSRECSYQLASRAFSNGEYSEASEQFKALGEYKDSVARWQESTYQYGRGLLNDGEVLDSYHVLYEVKDYLPAFSLLVSNSQFYIYVYDVGVGPNPLDE